LADFADPADAAAFPVLATSTGALRSVETVPLIAAAGMPGRAEDNALS